ncbi:hypothetical protein San01_34310 [Streptomyces angustmyceticus]|uniref:Secreted protein n=1 Tax=Streptomyces angustmyceticus TaxID=285578 RepID=A0A5J4LEL1_9ACTN|nr:hypothetical protein San01_34310 [Streptomyces angustmyceticus]
MAFFAVAFVATAFRAVAFFVTAFCAAAFVAAAGFCGVSFTAAFFPAEVLPTGVFFTEVCAVSCAAGRDAPDLRTARSGPDVTPGSDLPRLPGSGMRPDGCSPTAESRPALTLPAPHSSAPTGVLDTRPD